MQIGIFCFEAIVNVSNALVHVVKQALGSQRWYGDFHRFSITVYYYSIQK